jgi:hypothetical protein
LAATTEPAVLRQEYHSIIKTITCNPFHGASKSKLNPRRLPSEVRRRVDLDCHKSQHLTSKGAYARLHPKAATIP